MTDPPSSPPSRLTHYLSILKFSPAPPTRNENPPLPHADCFEYASINVVGIFVRIICSKLAFSNVLRNAVGVAGLFLAVGCQFVFVVAPVCLVAHPRLVPSWKLFSEYVGRFYPSGFSMVIFNSLEIYLHFHS